MKPFHSLCPSLVRFCLSTFPSVVLLACVARAQDKGPENRFERNVLAYETADRLEPPSRGAILLAGDSQFYRWKTLHEDLPGYTIIDRGVDSFQASDLIRYADRLIVCYRPRMIILNVGGNDVHNGKSPEQLLADFKVLVAKIRAVMPEVPIAFSSITPGPGRWTEAAQRIRANLLVSAYVATQPRLLFINLWDAMLTGEGNPREDLWMPDRIHSNHAGYLVRAANIRPILGSPDRKLETQAR